MFLLIILFGVLVLSLAFLGFWQAEVQGMNRPKPDPPAAAARKSAATDVPAGAQPAAAPPEEAPAATDPSPPEKSGTREP